MARTCSTVFINKPRETVFEYVTTASHWSAWHPATVAVSGDVKRSAEVGDTIVEKIRFMGRHDLFTWVVRERTFPERWVFDGTGASGAQAKITYTLSAQNQGTLFERELVYTMATPFIQFLDKLFLGRRMTAVSEKALERLKETLEAMP